MSKALSYCKFPLRNDREISCALPEKQYFSLSLIILRGRTEITCLAVRADALVNPFCPILDLTDSPATFPRAPSPTAPPWRTGDYRCKQNQSQREQNLHSVGVRESKVGFKLTVLSADPHPL